MTINKSKLYSFSSSDFEDEYTKYYDFLYNNDKFMRILYNFLDEIEEFNIEFFKKEKEYLKNFHKETDYFYLMDSDRDYFSLFLTLYFNKIIKI